MYRREERVQDQQTMLLTGALTLVLAFGFTIESDAKTSTSNFTCPAFNGEYKYIYSEVRTRILLSPTNLRGGGFGNMMNSCTFDYLYAATVTSMYQNDQLVAYMEACGLAGFFLPATDYEEEGVFKWIKTGLPVNFTNWAAGEPSMDRSRNCIAINVQGEWITVSCSRSTQYMAVCELPIICERTNILSDDKGTNPHPDQQAKPTAAQQVSPDMELIGRVGNKLYLYNASALSFFGTFDFCHERGLRMPTPVNAEEWNILADYSNITRYIPWTSYTDMMTPNCTHASSHYRSLYDGRHLDDPSLGRFDGRDACVIVRSTGYYYDLCDSMFMRRTVCELILETPVVE